MASSPPSNPVPPADDRRLPSEPARRVRIGLTGLAFVFLLVLVGTAILRHGGDEAVPSATTSAEAAPPVDPMAEIGAAPTTPKSESDEATDAPGASAGKAKN